MFQMPLNLRNALAAWHWIATNVFVTFIYEDGTFSIFFTILLNMILFLAYIQLLSIFIHFCIGTSYLFKSILHSKRGELLQELLQFPSHGMRETLLDMCFFHIGDEDIVSDETSKHKACMAGYPDISGKLDDLEEVFDHFERKLPFLMGLRERKFFTKTEMAIVEAIEKRRETWGKSSRGRIRWGLQCAFGFGPWAEEDRKRLQWGPDANNLYS